MKEKEKYNTPRKEANKLYPIHGSSEALDNQQRNFRKSFIEGYNYAKSDVNKFHEKCKKYEEALREVTERFSDRAWFKQDAYLIEKIKSLTNEKI